MKLVLNEDENDVYGQGQAFPVKREIYRDEFDISGWYIITTDHF